MTSRLKIFIDPLIKAKYGPEICWAWRVLLSGIGHRWEEVTDSRKKFDIAYSCSERYFKSAKLWVCADLILWDRMLELRLVDVKGSNGFIYSINSEEYYRDLRLIPHNGFYICGRDIIFDVYWLASGQEENHRPKNKHGFFDLSDSVLLKKQAFRGAFASRIALWLDKNIRKLGICSPHSRWPYNKKAAACLSHDVDYPKVIRAVEPLRIVLRQGFKGFPHSLDVFLGKSTHWHFCSWVTLERELGLRSGFYFSAVQGSLLKYALGVPDPFYDVNSAQFRELFDYLCNEGYEIGLHASYLAFENREKFDRERQKLQQASRSEIEGNRHHYWHLNPEDIESTLLIHEDIGLKYDMSLFFEQHIGWRRGLSWPFFPFIKKQRRELRTLQVNTTWMDNQLFGYSKLNPGDPLNILKDLSETTLKQGGCLCVDIHDYVYDDSLYPGWSKTYHSFLQYLVDCGDFWIVTPGEVADHWIKRYNAILEQSEGLDEGK